MGRRPSIRLQQADAQSTAELAARWGCNRVPHEADLEDKSVAEGERLPQVVFHRRVLEIDCPDERPGGRPQRRRDVPQRTAALIDEGDRRPSALSPWDCSRIELEVEESRRPVQGRGIDTDAIGHLRAIAPSLSA